MSHGTERKFKSRALAPCFAIVLMVGASCQWEDVSRPEREPLTEKVFVIGWDGADWKIIRPLLERGELPHLARLIANGAHGDLDTITTGRRGHASTVSGIHWRSASPGVLILSGAGIRSGAALGQAHVFDIAPTVLALLGLPAESSMDGRVLNEALVQ